MALTIAQIYDRVQYKLQDTTPTYFTDEKLATYNPDVIKVIDRYVPFRPVFPYELTTDGSTRRLKMSTSLLKDLLDIPQFEGVEYEVSQSPREFRNFTRQGNYIYLNVTTIPSASASVYVYPFKKHVIQESIGTTDTAGAVKTAGSADDTTLALKSLGTGTINENTVLTITGDTTDYIVQSTATIGTNEATVTIFPPLQADVDADTVVTLSLLNTLSWTNAHLEDIYCDYLAGLALSNESVSLVLEAKLAQTDIASARTDAGEVGKSQEDLMNLAKLGASLSNVESLVKLGQSWMAMAERELIAMSEGNKYKRYARD